MSAYPYAEPKARNNRRWLYILIAVLIGGALFYYFVLRGEGEKSCKDHTSEADCKSPCFWNSDTKQCSNVAPVVSPPPPSEPVVPESLTGHYIGSSYDVGTREWTDKSGKSNHIKDVIGNVNLSDDLTYIYGSTDVKFTLPDEVFDRSYTLITVAKYNGENKKRIFTSSEDDWYSGHNDGKSGVAKHDILITDDVDRHGDRWVVSVDQRDLYRSNGRTLSGAFLAQGFPGDIGVNIKNGLESDFAIAEIMIFNEAIDIDTIKYYESKLMSKYNATPARFALGNVKNGPHSDIFESVNVDCGLQSGLRGFKVYTDGSNDKSWYEYSCMYDLDKVGGQFSTTNDTALKTKTAYVADTFFDENLACGNKPLRGFEMKQAADNASLTYECSNSKVVSSTCRTVDAADQDVNDFTAHELLCDEEEVMTQFKLVKLPDDPNKARYSYTCCKPEGL